MLLNVPEQYPLMPPAVRYRTKIFHPNVHFKVCLSPVTRFCIVTSHFCQSDTKCCVSIADGRDLLGHLEDSMDTGVDATSCVPGHHGADV